MDITLATVQLALLFVPGLIWAMLDAAHRPSGQNTQFIYTLRVFVFGIFSYSIVGGIYIFADKSFDLISFTETEWSFQSTIDELLWATVTAVFLAVLWLYGRTNKWVTRTLNYIGATHHIADQDIWEFMFNSNDPTIKYIHVRDYKNGLIYTGYVRAYSERLDLRELAMSDVIVYTDKSEELYATPRLYLARGTNDITFEFPVNEVSNGPQTNK